MRSERRRGVAPAARFQPLSSKGRRRGCITVASGLSRQGRDGYADGGGVEESQARRRSVGCGCAPAASSGRRGTGTGTSRCLGFWGAGPVEGLSTGSGVMDRLGQRDYVIPRAPRRAVGVRGQRVALYVNARGIPVRRHRQIDLRRAGRDPINSAPTTSGSRRKAYLIRRQPVMMLRQRLTESLAGGHTRELANWKRAVAHVGR